MTLKEFAQRLNGREYDYQILAEQETQLAKENGWVIVTGASDDLVEFDGAMHEETGSGEVYFQKNKLYDSDNYDGEAYPNRIEARWFDKAMLDENGNVIPWIYKTDIPHEAFMVYEDGDPYCQGIIFSVRDLK